MHVHRVDRRTKRNRIRREFRKLFGQIELLEPRLPLSASSIDNRPYIDVGPSDNVAWDQPRVTVQLLTEDFPAGTEPPQNIIVGPNTFNSWLLDTGANTTLAFQTAVNDMSEFDPKYETDGTFNELGVGGVDLFDVSVPYRFDYAGSTSFERNTLLDSRIISKDDRDISIFGPWGIVGMPAMTERLTTVDFTPWTDVSGFDLFMETDFPAELPEPLGPRFTLPVDNRVNFSPEGSVVSGPGIPMWADLPFHTGELKNNENTASGNFLFDTGAQVSIISQAMAFSLGLDSNNDGVLSPLDANFARTETIGGIAGTTNVPVFLIDEVHLPTTQGPDLVWTDLQWIILDIVEGIDGVFGFDNMTSGWIEAFGIDGQSGYIMQSHFDFRGWDSTGQGEIHFDFNPEIFTLIDPTGAGAIVTESGDFTTVTENGVAFDTYEIRLSTAPTADVTVTFVGGGGQVGAFDAANPANDFVIFTPENWNVPRTVQVRANDDSVVEGYHRAFVRNVSSSADPEYDGVGMPRISVGIVDDDFAGMMIIPTDGDTQVTEGGVPDYYDVVLMTPPTEDVFILMQHVANQVEVVSDVDGTNLLTFTPTNWSTPQRVRVTAIDDALEEDLLPAYITHRIGSSDEEYQQAFALQEKAFVRDNDGPDQTGPKITNIIVGSSQWSSDFIDIVDGGGTGAGNGLGVSLVGASQLDNLPWINIDKVYLEFDDDVAADFNAANLQIAGLNVADYMSGAAIAFGVDGAQVGTITLATPLSNDIVTLSVMDDLQDAGGNALDGEWIDGVSSESGNGSKGGDFNFRIDVLPGDYDDSNGVNLVDVFGTLGERGNTTTSDNVRADMDGSGGINLVDVFAVLGRRGTTLPSQGGNLNLPPSGGSNKGGGGGLGAYASLNGYGGVSQAIVDGGRSIAELNQINPFLRRAIQHAQLVTGTATNATSGVPAPETGIPLVATRVDLALRKAEAIRQRAVDTVFEKLDADARDAIAREASVILSSRQLDDRTFPKVEGALAPPPTQTFDRVDDAPLRQHTLTGALKQPRR